METVIEFFETVDNYTDSYGVWAEQLTPNSKIILGQVANNSGTYLESILESIAPEGWHYLGTLQSIIDARSSWHEGITEFDTYFVDDYLYNHQQ